jgi:hypothetical protein
MFMIIRILRNIAITGIINLISTVHKGIHDRIDPRRDLSLVSFYFFNTPKD